jgi:HK97 gp10 family phage protein
MAGGIKFVVKSNRFPAIAKMLPEATAVIVNKHGQAIAQGAAQRSRVDTGAMRDGWRWNATGKGSGEVVNDVEYTQYNEFGTRYMAAQPMLRPAVEAEQGPFLDDLARLESFLK